MDDSFTVPSLEFMAAGGSHIAVFIILGSLEERMQKLQSLQAARFSRFSQRFFVGNLVGEIGVTLA